METSTRSAAPRQRKPRPKPARSIRLIIAPTATTAGVIRITVGKTFDDYVLTAMRSDFGRAFQLVKVFGEHDGYHVCLNGPESHCDCKGFASAKSGECK